MSREAASAFLAELESDEQLRGEILALQTSRVAGASLSTQALAERAAKSGFTFSAQELYDVCSEQRAREASLELRDGELDSVTGGSKNEVAIETLEIVHEGFGEAATVHTVGLTLGARRP